MNPTTARLARTFILSGLVLPLGAQQPELEPKVKVDPAPVSRQAGVITSFAPIVEKVGPSVVQISTSKNVRQGARNRGFDDPLFRRFFGLPEPDDDQDQGRSTPRRRPGRPGQNPQREALGLGSGVIVSAEGHILTNNHVVEGADDITVTLAGGKQEYKAKKIASDPDTDLAVLKLDEKPKQLTPVIFGDSDKLRVGDFAIAVGNPFGLTQTVTMGIVSSIGRNAMGIVAYENFIQTDASINPGNSGGALVDIEGRLIGINTAIFSRTGMNAGVGFAVPANLAHQVMDSLLTKGRVIRGYLGVFLDVLTDDLARKFKATTTDGAVITSVQPGSPAAQAGLEPGDVVTELNDRKVPGPSELRLSVSSMAPGTKVALKYLRTGQEKRAEVVLGELPKNARSGGAPTEPSQQTEPDVLDGVTVGDIESESRQKFGIPEGTTGVVVLSIDEESASYAAGIRVGDVIQEIEQKPVKSANDAVELSEQLKKEKEVLLRVSTRGASRFVIVKENP